MSLRMSLVVSDTVRIKIDYYVTVLIILGEQVCTQIIWSEKNEILLTNWVLFRIYFTS